jgi:hypothetical protein
MAAAPMPSSPIVRKPCGRYFPEKITGKLKIQAIPLLLPARFYRDYKMLHANSLFSRNRENSTGFDALRKDILRQNMRAKTSSHFT